MNEKLLLHDSETLKHINKVRENLWNVIRDLDHRAQIHDASKMEAPEREILAENTPKLAKTEYGSADYSKLLEEIKPALDHHYSKNRHHPEHWPQGVDDMNLMDLVELLCDWKAATERNKNGNIRKSIEHNAKRFNLSPQLEKILHNTVRELFKD
jgi:G3E family GTPase